ncbi:DUF192 domain-containing protein [Candidimonas sp. SYP-B2681]|uniref:DUF192 domain-containing protein n=1 Tax=Candidimonas sp. SYP-B2681 TaxID=2497686 RepID=UPI001F42DBF4|nr:DUF192 domain-containing protein [Candidimonas sp. SYP-B2681]
MLALTLIPLSVNAQGMLLPTTQLTIGSHTANVEIAATDSSRSYGLMQRQSLPRDHGMLFVFDNAGMPCFWMKNTPLALSIAFIDAKGRIVNIADMRPHSLEEHCPTAPAVYALEMERGWFDRHKIKAGATVSNLPKSSP